MTATQSLRIYEILNKHFHNESDAKIIVQEIEEVVEGKLLSKTDIFATKVDLAEAKADIIKWMFVFWTSSILVTLGSIFAIAKFIH